MGVDPLLQPILDAAAAAPPLPPDLPWAERRALLEGGTDQLFLALAEDPPAVAHVEDHQVAVDGGTITVRVYTPEGGGPFPAHVFFHGGGWFMGTLEQSDTVCKEFATGASCVVVSADYRLAPDHTFPTQPEDCYAALCWTVDRASELGIDLTRISVGGASAGGNLAAAVALMARDRGGPAIVLQVLEIPVTDLVGEYPSLVGNGEGYLVSKEAMDEAYAWYLGDAGDGTHPYASPMLADDLGGLPPAIVMTMEFDPLRDGGEAYAARLADFGVPVIAKRWPGHIHGSTLMTKLLPSAREYREEMIGHLRAAYSR